MQWPKGVNVLLGKGAPSNTNGANHDRVRKIMTQAFTREVVNGYVPRMAGVS